MKTTKGKLRNITTGILHTDITDVYVFLDEYLDMGGAMTHQIPSAFRALEPILKKKLPEEWFTNEWIKTGLDEVVEITDLSPEELKTFWEQYKIYASAMWDKIKNKTIVVKA